jgi:hypothetical protein
MAARALFSIYPTVAKNHVIEQKTKDRHDSNGRKDRLRQADSTPIRHSYKREHNAVKQIIPFHLDGSL